MSISPTHTRDGRKIVVIDYQCTRCGEYVTLGDRRVGGDGWVNEDGRTCTHHWEDCFAGGLKSHPNKSLVSSEGAG